MMELLIGRLLKAGVITAASVVAFGGTLYLVQHGFEPADYRVFHPAAAGVISDYGRGLIQMGLLILIATPIARVVLSLFLFARKRDAAYVVISLIVLCVLAYGFLGKR